MRTKEQRQLEEQLKVEDSLDLLLFKALQVTKLPTKRGLTIDNNFIDLYPVPVFKGNYVKAVEYRVTKAVFLPEVLLNRLIQLEDDIEAHVNAIHKEDGRGRKPKYTQADTMQWLELRDQGLTYGEIAEICNASANTVGNYIRKYNKKNK